MASTTTTTCRVPPRLSRTSPSASSPTTTTAIRAAAPAGKAGVLLPRRHTLNPGRVRNGGDPPPDRLDEGNDHPDDDEYLDDRPWRSGALRR